MRDVAIGLKPIPNEIARLEEIASPAQTQQEDTSDTDLVGEYISYFLHISASNSRSSSEPRLRPFVERNDILKELEILGFNDENIDINTSVSSARYFATGQNSTDFWSATSCGHSH